MFISSDGYLDPELINKFKIDIKAVPYLIHNNIAITGHFPIIKYCCIQFGRLDLLGNSLEDSILIAEIMAKEIRQRGVILHTLFNGIREVINRNLGEAGILGLKKKIAEVATEKQMIPLRKMYQKHGGFICGYLTILDLLYYEKTFYVSSFIGDSIPNVPSTIQLALKYKEFFEGT